MVEQGPLFKLGVFNVRMQREQPPRHFEQVIDVTAFVSSAINSFAQLIRWTKVLVTTMTSGGVTVMERNCFPEEFGGVAIRLFAGIDITHQDPEQLRDLRVPV